MENNNVAPYLIKEAKPLLIHVPLEPYQARYTEHLRNWESAAFMPHFEVTTVCGDKPSGQLRAEVLDPFDRSRWALSQMHGLVSVMETLKGQVPRIYFSDFFHPGLEALPYTRREYRAFAFCWAQSFDQYDFTRRLGPWMRMFEYLAFEIYDMVFVAHEGLKDLIVSAIPALYHKIAVVGLPFDVEQVRQQLDLPSYTDKLDKRHYDVVYSSRWDVEKSPRMLVELAKSEPELSFAVCTGLPQLKGTDSVAVEVIKNLPNVEIHEGLTKAQYYAILSNSKVQLNTAYQDWVSFTLLEALTFGCRPLYPNHRSFPSTLNHVQDNLYTPGNLESLRSRLSFLLDTLDAPAVNQVQSLLRSEVLDYHGGTLDRIAKIMAAS